MTQMHKQFFGHLLLAELQDSKQFLTFKNKIF